MCGYAYVDWGGGGFHIKDITMLTVIPTMMILEMDIYIDGNVPANKQGTVLPAFEMKNEDTFFSVAPASRKKDGSGIL